MKRKEFYSSDPIQTFLDVVDEKREIIPLPRKFAEDSAWHLKEILKEREDAQRHEIWGFHEDEFPVYTTRKGCHPELSSPMTVDEANHLITQIKELYRLARLRTPR